MVHLQLRPRHLLAVVAKVHVVLTDRQPPRGDVAKAARLIAVAAGHRAQALRRGQCAVLLVVVQIGVEVANALHRPLTAERRADLLPTATQAPGHRRVTAQAGHELLIELLAHLRRVGLRQRVGAGRVEEPAQRVRGVPEVGAHLVVGHFGVEQTA
ncbi:hypothetical protein D3C85_1034790 [compost metagenome]